MLLVLAVAGALTYPIVGQVIDRYGARRVILPGLVFFAASVALVSVTTANPVHFYLTYAILGVTAAIPSSWFARIH